jgi:hypothetical protein
VQICPKALFERDATPADLRCVMTDDAQVQLPELSYPPPDGTSYTEILTNWFEQQHGRTSIGRLVEEGGGSVSVVDVSGQQDMGELPEISDGQDMRAMLAFVAAELHALRGAMLALADGLDRQRGVSVDRGTAD